MAEIFLANASTAPGTNQITVAVDTVSPYLRTRKQTPATATYEIDLAQRLELLSTYFPGEVQAGAAPDQGRSRRHHRPAPGELCRRDGLRARLAVGRARRPALAARAQPHLQDHAMRAGMELEPLLRSFADLDVYRVVHAPGGA